MGWLGRLFDKHLRGGHHGNGHHGGSAYRPPAVAAVCPGCHASIASNSRFCPRCGTSVLPEPCPHCRASQPAGARFCGQCGQPAV